MNRLPRPATIDDGVDFFLGCMSIQALSLQYEQADITIRSDITSDLMGSVATRHLQLSDYHLEGTRHPDCIALAQLQ